MAGRGTPEPTYVQRGPVERSIRVEPRENLSSLAYAGTGGFFSLVASCQWPVASMEVRLSGQIPVTSCQFVSKHLVSSEARVEVIIGWGKLPVDRMEIGIEGPGVRDVGG